MEMQTSPLNKILEARETRSELRRMVASTGVESISLSFNIQGYPKSDTLISEAFAIVKNELIQYVSACRISVAVSQRHEKTDEAGDFLLIPLVNNKLSISEIKSLMESFEESHSLQRLIDVDVFDRDAQAVSSGKAKKCLICNEPAIVCMRKSAHHSHELRAYATVKITDFLKIHRQKKISQQLSSLATRALLTEASVSPKPGLVDRLSQGAHTDMDYYSFISSTAALSYYWNDIAHIAFEWDGKDISKTVIRLRLTGMKMETAMLQATRDVNTQKGAIFMMGFTVFAIAYCLYNKLPLTDDRIRTVISQLNKNLTINELNKSVATKSNGQKVYERYGDKLGGGIRQEMEDGLPTVFLHALPALRLLTDVQYTDRWWNESLKEILLLILSVNDDTNILHRSDAEILKTFQQMAFDCREATPENKAYLYQELINFCLFHHISPGGSADLLAVTCFVFWVQTELML